MSPKIVSAGGYLTRAEEKSNTARQVFVSHATAAACSLRHFRRYSRLLCLFSAGDRLGTGGIRWYLRRVLMRSWYFGAPSLSLLSNPSSYARQILRTEAGISSLGSMPAISPGIFRTRCSLLFLSMVNFTFSLPNSFRNGCALVDALHIFDWIDYYSIDKKVENVVTRRRRHTQSTAPSWGWGGT